MEPRRKQARRDGNAYQPEPVVFDFQDNGQHPASPTLLQIGKPETES